MGKQNIKNIQAKCHSMGKRQQETGWKYVTKELCQTRTAGVVDGVYVNIVTWSVGCERVGELEKVGAVVSRPGTRVDGYSHHKQRSWFSK
jgi:hypothetical protein